MNYNIQDICCICLSISNKKCSNKSSKSPDNLTPLDKIKTIFSQLASVMESDDRICTKCTDTVGFIYEFHKTCLNNINIFSSYKKILKENQPNKQIGLLVDLNEWQKFKENILNPKEIKVEPQEALLSDDDMLLDANFVEENHSSGPTEIKKEIDINDETHDEESETIWLNPNIKIEYEETDLKGEFMSETNETSNVESLKSNIEDFENTSVQSSVEMVEEEEEKQELIEDPLQEVADEKTDEGRGHFKVIVINRSESSEEKIVGLESHIPLIHSKRKTDTDFEDTSDQSSQEGIVEVGKQSETLSCQPDLYGHMFIGHSMTDTHTGEKSMKCDICGKSFDRLGKLQSHMLTHTGEKPYKCDTCGNSFTQKGNLKQHMLIHTGSKPHKCNICGKSFSQKSALGPHMLIHTGEKPYKCDICEKSFIQLSKLQSHMLIHTGEKSYKCDTCEKSFTRKDTLQIHQMTHTGEKPHKCEGCGKLFKHKYYLKLHMLKNHTDEPLHKCNDCGKSFIQKKNLESHMRTHNDGLLHKCYFCGNTFSSRADLKSHLQKNAGDELHTTRTSI